EEGKAAKDDRHFSEIRIPRSGRGIPIDSQESQALLRSNANSRMYRNIGSARETPTSRSAINGSQRLRMPARALSTLMNTNSTIAETNTSIPKNAPIRVEKSSWKNNDSEMPC